MTTGIGRRRMIFSRNSRPFMFGISTSSVMTSGLRSLDRLARLQRIAGLADDLDLGIAAKDGGDQPAHGGGVVDDEDAYGTHAAASLPI